jgi:hypothetical protein
MLRQLPSSTWSLPTSTVDLRRELRHQRWVIAELHRAHEENCRLLAQSRENVQAAQAAIERSRRLLHHTDT